MNRAHLCGEWADAVGHEAEAKSHVSFPEIDASSCFVPVRYAKGRAKPDPIPAGCGYPEGDEASADSLLALEREAARYDAIAAGSTSDLPLDLACDLPPAERTRAARINAATLRATAIRAKKTRWPYAAVSTFGYGSTEQEHTPLLDWRPGEPCPKLSPIEMGRLQPNVTRAGHAADAWHAGVAPVVTVSGGAVHSKVYEAWLLDFLVTCRMSVPADAVLVDPCADHTHTNVRNTASLVVALGGRAAYVVTDAMQAGYLQDWTTFDLIGGSIDQRSLRDFGYLAGSFRQASVGERWGFWLTPYRFWAEPKDGLGSVTCVR